MVLTANTTDLCVGHLASEKGKKFLNTNEVGEMKNKFLYYCTGDVNLSWSGFNLWVVIRSRGYKTFFKLSSAEHEISTVHRC